MHDRPTSMIAARLRYALRRATCAGRCSARRHLALARSGFRWCSATACKNCKGWQDYGNHAPWVRVPASSGAAVVLGRHDCPGGSKLDSFTTNFQPQDHQQGCDSQFPRPRKLGMPARGADSHHRAGCSLTVRTVCRRNDAFATSAERCAGRFAHVLFRVASSAILRQCRILRDAGIYSTHALRCRGR